MENGRREAERLIRAENVIDRIAELRPRWLMTPHLRGQAQLLASRHKIRVAIPGNGWGKTTSMAMDLDMAIQKDDPFKGDLLPSWPITAVWVCQKFQQMDILRRQLEQDVWTRPWDWNQSRHFYQWKNGGILHIVSSDSQWEHIQGIPVDVVCFDEHPDRKLWNEFMFRRRGRYKTRYMVAATMTLGMTWFVREVIQEWEKYHREQGIRGEDARTQQKHPNIWVWDCGGIRDNPAMDKEDVEHYESITHASDKELRIRLNGGYADFTGDSVFDQDSLNRQVPNLKKSEDGSLHLIDWNECKLVLPDGTDATHVLKNRVGGRNTKHYVQWLLNGAVDGGRVSVWEPPQIDSTYCIGADFAAGLVGRDYDYCCVLKKSPDGDCEQVAEAMGWWGDSVFAEILYALGLWYYNAFICGERQFGLPTLRRLYDEYHYSYIFRGRLESTRSRRPSDLLGHHRSPGDTIIPNLRAGLLRNHLTLRSEEVMAQLRQYQWQPRNKSVDPETATSEDLITTSPTGMNDDAVMGIAYAWHAAREIGKFTMPAAEYAPGTYGSLFGNDRVLRGLQPKKDKVLRLG